SNRFRNSSSTSSCASTCRACAAGMSSVYRSGSRPYDSADRSSAMTAFACARRVLPSNQVRSVACAWVETMQAEANRSGRTMADPTENNTERMTRSSAGSSQRIDHRGQPLSDLLRRLRERRICGALHGDDGIDACDLDSPIGSFSHDDVAG